MKIEYIRNLTGSYMIVKDAEYPYENAELLMLLNNKIPGLLDLQVIISDGKMEYWYEITGTTSFETLLDAALLNGIKLRQLIEDIYDMNRQLEDYLLDGENIQYLPEMIYFERTTEKYRFCYLPGSKQLNRNSLQTLTEHLLTKIDHKDADAVSMGYSLYEKSMQESCSLQELLSCVLLSKEETTVEESEDKEKLPIKWHQDSQEERLSTVDKHIFEEQERLKESDEEKSAIITSVTDKRGIWGRLSKRRKRETIKTTPDYAEQLAAIKVQEVVAEPIYRDCPTMFLNMEKQIEIGKLIYQGEGKEDNFLLEEDVFLIGKDRELTNGVLRADTVSRIHARIFRQEGTYYIEDLNSTNGTYLNGREVFYRQPQKLEKMDRISFATEEYLFG